MFFIFLKRDVNVFYEAIYLEKGILDAYFLKISLTFHFNRIFFPGGGGAGYSILSLSHISSFFPISHLCPSMSHLFPLSFLLSLSPPLISLPPSLSLYHLIFILVQGILGLETVHGTIRIKVRKTVHFSFILPPSDERREWRDSTLGRDERIIDRENSGK